MSLLRRPGAVHAVGVPLARPDAGEVAVPVERRPLGQRDADLVVVGVEQAELDVLGAFGEEREVRPLFVPRRAERKRPPRPDAHATGPFGHGRGLTPAMAETVWFAVTKA